MAEGKIICAVDFGTTYSGVAYAYVEQGTDPSNVEMRIIEDDWPGQGNQSSPKVPSVFKFDPTAPDGFQWGFQLNDDSDKICFSKLYLDPDQLQKAKKLATLPSKVGRLPPNRTLTDGVTKFLGALRDFALDHMAEEWGQNFVDSTPIEYMLTLPAVWSDKAKSDTLWCASQAGFGPENEIKSITEPEAAALYCFSTFPDFSIKENDVFVTCDAGGGTVDLTSYRVTATKPVLRVNEATVGTGGVCGSVYLNRRFEDLVKSRLRKQLDAMSKSKALQVVNELQKRFNDEIKPLFGGDSDGKEEYLVEVPPGVADDEAAGIHNGNLSLTLADLKYIYDDVINAIITLIWEQIGRVEALGADAKASAILLVGGFGGSEYLRVRVEEHFGGETKVVRPVDAWSAIVRGAMLKAIQGEVVESRKIRAYYGVRIEQAWDPIIHEAPHLRAQAEEKKIWDELEQEYYCAHVMTWYVKKGDEFSDTKVVQFPFYRNLTSLRDLVLEDKLYIYTGDDGGPTIYNEDCTVVTTLKADLSSIPKSSFQLISKSSGDYYKISYALEMRFSATISFKLIIGDKAYGEVDCTYDRK